MKKICFVEMEGLITPFGHYQPNGRRVKSFLEDLLEFSKEKGVEVFLVSGHAKEAAIEKLASVNFEGFFDEKHFLFVDEKYISKKAEMDKKVYEASLAKDPEFVDTYFKQVIISEIMKKKRLSEKDILLLSNDIWVDGYYTTRFSKVDFAIFEENIMDRGKPAERMSGLAYFNLDFASVKPLIEKFPHTDHVALDKYVFESMKKALIGDNFTDLIKKGLEKKQKGG